jgi:hypothetical protein
VQSLLGPYDSLDPKVCFDIYQRRIEQLPERMPDNNAWPFGKFGQVTDAFGDSRPVVPGNNTWLFGQVTDAFGNPHGKVLLPVSPKELLEGTRVR